MNLNNRWKAFILKYLPNLKEFYLEYHEHTFEEDDDDEYLVHLDGSNHFTSSFWIERQWVFEAEIYDGEIIYYVRPDKYIEIWFLY